MIFLILFAMAGVARLINWLLDKAQDRATFKVEDDLSEKYINH